jgi:hypothetical protein
VLEEKVSLGQCIFAVQLWQNQVDDVLNHNVGSGSTSETTGVSGCWSCALRACVGGVCCRCRGTASEPYLSVLSGFAFKSIWHVGHWCRRSTTKYFVMHDLQTATPKGWCMGQRRRSPSNRTARCCVSHTQTANQKRKKK